MNFNKKDEIVGGGLGKIMTKHPEDIAMLPEVIARGNLKYINDPRNRRSALIEYNGYISVFRLNMNGDRQTWLLTYYEKGN